MTEEKPESSFQMPGNGKGPLAKTPPLVFIFLSLSVVFFLYQIIGSSITYLILGSDIDINAGNVNVTRLIITFAQFMFILVPAVILVMLQDNNIKETFRLKKPKMSVFILAIIGIFVIQPFLQMFMYYQNELIFNLPFGQEFLTRLKEIFDTLEASTEKLVTANSIPEFLMIVIVIAVTPAICEEFLFRGLVFKNFEKIISPGKAIFFTGLLFALFHFHPFNLIPLFILGIYLTLVVYHSGSIYTAIAVHFINNFISALAVYIYGSEMLGSDAASKITGSEQTELLIYGIISFIGFLIIVYLIKKNSAAKSELISGNELQNISSAGNE
ncbi:MAG: CPBP family intramembrane metalloprotease [Ignavibacteriae bacterium]|nr:CPBP family intramembrane metalloprotease [Ignavibacteriota bacterium]